MNTGDLSSWGKMTMPMPKGWTGSFTGNEQYSELNEFPLFKDGDVKIVIEGFKTYQLHSNILKAMSPFFNKMLAEKEAAVLSKNATKKGIVTRFRFKLVKVDRGSKNGAIGREFVKVALDDHGKPMTAQASGFTASKGFPMAPVEFAFHAVLGAFYNHPITFQTSPRDTANADLIKATQVLEVAEYLQAIHVIVKPVEAELLTQGQKLYRSIASTPAGWLHFASRVQSGFLFREAFIHAVGQYNTPAMKTSMEMMLSKQVNYLLTEKAAKLRESVQKAQSLMVSYYPTELHREITVGRADLDGIGRAHYSNDIFKWMSLTAFRHWLHGNVVDDETHHATDMGWEFMVAVSKGGDVYLTREEMVGFHRFFPTSGKGANVIEDYITELKEYVKRWALPLLKNKSQLDTTKYPTPFFTCVGIEYDEYPWKRGMRVVAEEEEDSASELYE